MPFQRAARLLQMRKQARALMTAHPAAWAVGRQLAAVALATRSPDLVRLIREQGKAGINLYVEEIAEANVNAAAAGEIALGEPPTQEALTAMGIAMVMDLSDALEREAKTSPSVSG